MSTLVAFADVQGNAWALRAVLERARKWRDVELVCLGNAVGDAAHSSEALEVMRKVRVTLLRGPRDEAALGAGASACTPADLAYLRQASAPTRHVVTSAGPLTLTSLRGGSPPAGRLLVQPGPRLLHDAAAGRVEVAPLHEATGEAPFVIIDLDALTVRLEHAAWDVDAWCGVR